MPNPEQQLNGCPVCGYPKYAGHGPECPNNPKIEAREIEKPLNIQRVEPGDEAAVERYLRFEVDHGFTTMVHGQTFEDKLKLRAGQINSDKLRAAIAEEGDEIVATTEIVLVKGAKGKDIKEDEAWASGTLVSPDKRNSGVGEKMAAWQDEMAKEAGKKFIRTAIAQKNSPSMRLRMKVGYELNGVTVDPSDGDVDYQFRKDLSGELKKKNWVKELETGQLAETAPSKNSPDQILIDPDDNEKISKAIGLGYKGKFLLRPEDFKGDKKISKNLIVFSK